MTTHYPVAREVTTLVCDGRSLPDIQSIYERTFKVEGFSAKWLYCFDPFRGPEYYFVCSWPNRDGKYGAWHMRFLLCDFARSMHKDVFVFNLTEQASRERGHVVVPDCRYLNETMVTKQIMGEVRNWRVIHLHIETEGVGPANEEEAASIREMLEGTIPDQTYVFKPNSAVTIREVAASVAKHLQL